MANHIDGVIFERNGDYAICHVENFSDQIKCLIRRNLATICHGTHVSDYVNDDLYCYKSTLESFIARYNTKGDTIKIGMIGEFISHILITELFDEFSVVSAFFNLEEKSIKKGFDLLLYSSLDKSVWITEVKSGNRHKDKSLNQTTKDLLNTAKNDLKSRLGTQETMYWLNAVNSVRCSLSDNTDYKSTLEEILRKNGSSAHHKNSKSSDKCVVLVSGLFEPLTTKVSKGVPETFLETVKEAKLFAKTVVFCIQKETYTRVIDFLASEINGSNA